MNTENSNQTSATKPRYRSVIIGLIIIAVAILIISLLKSMQPEPATTERSEKAWSVSAVTLQADDIRPQLQLLGSVEAPFTSLLRASINADVTAVPVSEGEHVNAGQELILLDDREARLTLAQRQADADDLAAQIDAEKNRHQQDLASLKNEQNLVDLAEKAVARESELKKSNVTSDAKIDASRQLYQQQQLSLQARQLNINNHRSRLSQLESKLLKANALLDLAKLDIERTRPRAPFDAIISAVNVSPGERVRPGDALVQLYDINRIEIRAQVPAQSIDKVSHTLSTEHTATAWVNTPNMKTPINLVRLAGVVNKGGGGVDAIFAIPSGLSTVVPGQTLSVLVELPAEESVFSVPVSAIYGEDRVYKVEGERLKAIAINKVGQRFEGGKLSHLIKSDKLKSGDQIIITQLANAVTGLKVNIRQ
ncbi:MAG: HlyD family efflux transporter periplasmic adaptor subunit [Hahellaceae bacterium]|nr:HlyD family efflux transporter periplasmic adaptor subunit [Hahellaceae bacterium]MCP5211084.1 HlyD family efflux transporter periplasmic adaptor subunit [Hahellaceae bacterium]